MSRQSEDLDYGILLGPAPLGTGQDKGLMLAIYRQASLSVACNLKLPLVDHVFLWIFLC